MSPRSGRLKRLGILVDGAEGARKIGLNRFQPKQLFQRNRPAEVRSCGVLLVLFLAQSFTNYLVDAQVPTLVVD